MRNTNPARNRKFTADQFDRTATRMKSWLYSLARRRSTGTFTADDANRFLDREGVQTELVRSRL